ncbi:hypothetical protein [Butyrivibrio sp. AE2032]|uniref:hypothetical protein n=1 Tax=Butyrivibrio sp. AE2032 TaxID=1458463 RepID=UPI00054E5160|nr:hypothetical protein [Butyrivibrio sp. AE2032]
MFIDNLGIHHEGVVFIPDDAVLEECFKVRVLKIVNNNYKVVGEEFFPMFPEDDRIMWCIARYKGTQAVVEKVYWIDSIPFADGGEEEDGNL